MPTPFREDPRSSESISPSLRMVLMVLLLGLTLALRFAPLPENFSAFGALAIFCGMYTRGGFRWWFPLAALLSADCIGQLARVPGMGFYHPQSMLLNYLGLAVMTLVGAGLGNWSRQIGSISNSVFPLAIARTAGVALIASACFFLLSNFGAWLDPLMQYEKSPAGLLNCYVAGLPFWRATLLSDVLFTVGFSAFAAMFASVAKPLELARQKVDRS
ncbi:MAG: hypothetical protein NTV29_01470 [Planctomycetota bacterium]|nr:hypothetical protein [Planctomycetota bacterium]